MEPTSLRKYQIWMVDLSPSSGSEQSGIRPCLVVQHNEVNKRAKTTVICPITTSLKRFFWTLIIEPSVENGLSKKSRVDILQIKTVDKSRLKRKMGNLEKQYHAIFNAKFAESFDLEDDC